MAANAKALEAVTQETLERVFPEEKYPFNIDVAYDSVHVTDYAGIDERETIPTGVGLDRQTAIVETVERIIKKLRESGKLAVSEVTIASRAGGTPKTARKGETEFGETRHLWKDKAKIWTCEN
jgi:hypothetical protein